MTLPVIVNRLTGKALEVPPKSIVNGLLAVVSEDAETGECLLAGLDGRWSATFPAASHDVELPLEVLPSVATTESLITIATSVAGHNGSLTASAVSPLVPASRRGIDLEDEDVAVRDALPYLEAAAQRPYRRLTRIGLVAPVGRARRLHSKAPMRLAAHSEDWGRVTRSGVQPRQVLASEIVEEPDIYENAVLVECLVTAHRFVWLRHQQTGELQSFYSVLKEMLATVERHHWRSSERLYELIGDAYGSYDEGWATEVEAELATLLRKLGATLATPLGRETTPLGRRPLHGTNLLTDDARYRSAYQLLLQLRRRGDDESVDDSSSGLIHDHTVFCVLLVLRSLNYLENGVEDRMTAVPRRGSVLSVSEQWSVEWTALDVVSVLHASGERLDIVPVQHALDSEDAWDALDLVLAEDRVAAHKLIGYLPTSPSLGESAPWAIDALQHEQADPRLPGIVPLSPLDPRSELRITRALRKIELGVRFRRYGEARSVRPATVRAFGNCARSWVEVLDPSTIAITSPPTPSELATLEEAVAPSKVYSRSRSVSDEWSAVQGLIQRSTRDIAALRVCPVCGARPASFEPRKELTFWCRCDQCTSSWGLRICDAGHRFPVVIPQGVTMPDRPTAGWVAEALGSYGVAVPCVAQADFATFVCPVCYVCPEAPSRASSCARCSSGSAQMGA